MKSNLMPLKVYVAGKYSATQSIETAHIEVLQNIGRGRKVCADLFDQGFAPYCPWHDSTFIIDNPNIASSKQHFIDCSIQWLLASDCMLVLDGSHRSKGVRQEIKIAFQNSIPTFYSITALREYRYEQTQKGNLND